MAGGAAGRPGYVAARFGRIAKVLPGTAERTLRPGSPARPSPAITPLCRLLREQNAAATLARTIDMRRIVLGRALGQGPRGPGRGQPDPPSGG